MWVGRKLYSLPRVPKFLYMSHNKEVDKRQLLPNVHCPKTFSTHYSIFVYLGDFQEVKECYEEEVKEKLKN